MKCNNKKCRKDFGNETKWIIFNALPDLEDRLYCSEKCKMTYYDG